MSKVLDKDGRELGRFDGERIKDASGHILFWLSDDEVFAPLNYEDTNLAVFNKGQLQLIGEYVGGRCLVNGELLFTVCD